MNERPIIMSGDSVRAILDGTKSQTRRVIKPQIEDTEKYIHRGGLWHPCYYPGGRGEPEPCYEGLRCPYGVPGDRLWVRETWGGVFMEASGHILQWRDVPCHRRTQEHCNGLFYRATDNDPDYEGCWASPIFMPKFAARIWLEVVSVRAERLQEITKEDAFAEGIVTGAPYEYGEAIECFHALWDSINAKRGCGWDTDPWVWAVEFANA